MAAYGKQEEKFFFGEKEVEVDQGELFYDMLDPVGLAGTVDEPVVRYRYSEDEFLAEVKNYVASTYQGHYVGGGQYQTVDIWNTLGSASTTCRDTAIKYLMRYGKKGGNNKKDLLKAIHYITLLNHFSQESNNDETYR
jgi:hypothetical protein